MDGAGKSVRPCFGLDGGGHDHGDHASATVKTVEYQPVAPEGNGSARSSVCTVPVPSVARTSRRWEPGVASQASDHCRQVSSQGTEANCAGCQSPPSARTSTASM